MGFLRIFYVRKNISKVFLFSYNLVHETFLKILAIGVTLAVPSSLHINSRKFTKHPPTIFKNVFNKCLNDLLVFAQSWFDYPCFFYENYKQLYSGNIFRKILDFTYEKYTCKIKTIKQKSTGLLKNLVKDMSSMSHFVVSTQNYFSYFFKVEETPTVKDEKVSPNSKENLENEKGTTDSMLLWILASVRPRKANMDPSCITMDTEYSSENVHSGHSAESVKRKPDEEYRHKLKRPRNSSQTSSWANDASRTDSSQDQLVSKDEMFLSSSSSSESLSRESEEQEIQSLLSAHRFGASVSTEDESIVNFKQVQLEDLESMKRLNNTSQFNGYLGNENVLVMSKDELYSLGTDESEIQEEILDLNEKSGNETKNILGNEKFLPLTIDEFNPETVIYFKKLNLLPSNERWEDIADEINALKKQIARKDRVC